MNEAPQPLFGSSMSGSASTASIGALVLGALQAQLVGELEPHDLNDLLARDDGCQRTDTSRRRKARASSFGNWPLGINAQSERVTGNGKTTVTWLGFDPAERGAYVYLLTE